MSEHETPPTPAVLPIGPRSVVPAGRRKFLPLAPPPTPAPEPLVSPLADTGPWSAPKPAPPPAEASSPQLVRPYARTGGRTRAGYRLELETLLTTSYGHERDIGRLRADHRKICETCRLPQSTAEVAAYLGLPLGAARVLIADVVDVGLLVVHEASEDRPSLDLLFRVAKGLRNL